MANPVYSDGSDYICPISAVVTSGECGAAESVVSVIATRRMLVPYEQRILARLLNSRTSTAFTMPIFQGLHEYSGSTAIKHYFGIFDSSRLGGKGRLCFLYAGELNFLVGQVHILVMISPKVEVSDYAGT